MVFFSLLVVHSSPKITFSLRSASGFRGKKGGSKTTRRMIIACSCVYPFDHCWMSALLFVDLHNKYMSHGHCIAPKIATKTHKFRRFFTICVRAISFFSHHVSSVDCVAVHRPLHLSQFAEDYIIFDKMDISQFVRSAWKMGTSCSTSSALCVCVCYSCHFSIRYDFSWIACSPSIRYWRRITTNLTWFSFSCAAVFLLFGYKFWCVDLHTLLSISLFITSNVRSILSAMERRAGQ